MLRRLTVKPACFDMDDWVAWNFHNGNTQPSERVRCHCHDCQPWFADAMAKQGLCHPPAGMMRRVCHVCQHEFFPAAAHVGTCEQCKSLRQMEGIAVPLLNVCILCGKEYTGHSGRKGICHDCVPQHRKDEQKRRRAERREHAAV